jgi:hypothetical protein
MKRRKWPTPERILGVVVDEADDGFCASARVIERLSEHEARAARSGLRRAIRRGLLIERRGEDGRRYVALSSEGWRIAAR